MGKLPRFNVPGHAHFVTTKTFGNRLIFRDNICCRVVLINIEYYRRYLGFEVIGHCLMPDHLHLIVWWDAEKFPALTISKIMLAVKGNSVRQIVDYIYKGGLGCLTRAVYGRGQGTSPTQHIGFLQTRHTYPRRRMTDQEYKIWQPSFYDFNFYSEKKLLEKLAYIHDNPRRAGLAARALDYPYSSARNYFFGRNSPVNVNTSLV